MNRNIIIYTRKVRGFHFYLWVGTIYYYYGKKSFYAICIIFGEIRIYARLY